MQQNNFETFYPLSQKAWRQWLIENHNSRQAVWLARYKKQTKNPTIALEKEFKTKLNSKNFFLSLSKSVRKTILQWLVLAKRPETSQKQITEIVGFADQKLKPNICSRRGTYA